MKQNLSQVQYIDITEFHILGNVCEQLKKYFVTDPQNGPL